MNSRAFTLIELLIVVAIIAILAAIAVPNFLEAQTRAKVSRARSDMRTEVTALESYHIDHNTYPRQIEAFVSTPSWDYAQPPLWHEHIPSSLTTPIAYLSTIPTDPFKPLVADWRLWLKPFEGRHFLWVSDVALKRTPSSAFYKQSKEIGGAYAMFSYGPDRKYYNEPPGKAAKTAGQWIDYDSTNGTVSLGNIIRSQKNGEVFGVVPSFLY